MTSDVEPVEVRLYLGDLASRLASMAYAIEAGDDIDVPEMRQAIDHFAFVLELGTGPGARPGPGHDDALEVMAAVKVVVDEALEVVDAVEFGNRPEAERRIRSVLDHTAALFARWS